MDSHVLSQTDLAELFFGHANVSKFLNGERPLSKNQIARLNKGLKVSADFFVKQKHF